MKEKIQGIDVQNSNKPTLLRLSMSAKMSANSSLIDIVRANIDQQRQMQVTAYWKAEVQKKANAVKGISVVETNPSPDKGSEPNEAKKKRIVPPDELKKESDF